MFNVKWAVILLLHPSREHVYD